MTAWWWGIPPVAREMMPCAAGGHWARWAQGLLELPELDAEAEGVLSALGGRACRCADIARAWAALDHDVRMLVVGPRTPDDPISVDLATVRAIEEDRLPSFRAWENHRRARAGGGDRSVASGTRSAADVGVDRWTTTFALLLVLTLPNALLRRLVTTVGHATEQRWDTLTPEDRALVTAAVTGRAAPYLRASLVRSGSIDRNESPIIDVRVAAPGARPMLAAERTDAGLRVEAVLAADWLRAVWGREVVLRGDRFVTEVTDVTEARAERGVAVRWRRSNGNTRVETVVEEWENGDPRDGEPPS